MYTYRFKVTYHERIGKQWTERVKFFDRKYDAEDEVTRYNREHYFRHNYATVETVCEGSDPLADQAHAFVARYMKKNWRL